MPFRRVGCLVCCRHCLAPSMHPTKQQPKVCLICLMALHINACRMCRPRWACPLVFGARWVIHTMPSFLKALSTSWPLSPSKIPVAFRLALLKNAPRYAAVLKLATEKAKWGSALPAGHAHGVALHESFGSIVAQVAEVSMQDGKPRVHRVVCAIDCGTVVNPGTVAQQVESSVIFALTAALYGQIDIQEGVVQQNNFTNYPLVKHGAIACCRNMDCAQHQSA
jgi:hypothetical protein